MMNKDKEKILELMSEVKAKVEQMEKITQDQISFLIQRLQDCGAQGIDGLRKWDEYRKRRGL